MDVKLLIQAMESVHNVKKVFISIGTFIGLHLLYLHQKPTPIITQPLINSAQLVLQVAKFVHLCILALNVYQAISGINLLLLTVRKQPLLPTVLVQILIIMDNV